MNIPPWIFAVIVLAAILIASAIGAIKANRAWEKNQKAWERCQKNAKTGSSSETDEPANAAAFRSFLSSLPMLQIPIANNTWRDWMKSQTQGLQSLRGILRTDFKREFKERSLILLLAPPGVALPEDLACGFKGTDVDVECLQDLPEELHAFAITIIEAGIYAASDHTRTRLSYQECIRQLFPQISEELRERLYEASSLRDSAVHWKTDDDSSYLPWLNMLHDRRISDAWKRRADNDMRAIARRELQARAKLRSEYKGAFDYYTKTLQGMPFGDGLPYGADLYADQTAFALDLAELQDACVHDVCSLAYALRLLDRQTHAELRQRLIANTWRHDPAPNLYDEYLQEARDQLTEIRDSHPETATIIERAVQEGERCEQEERKSEEKRAQEIHTLEAAMRRI